MESDNPTRRVAIVTGAAHSIGRAIALRLAADGLDVAVNDIPGRAGELEEIVNEIEKLGRKGLSIPGDASREDFIKILVETTVEKLGGIDVFAANAGIIGARSSILKATVEDYDHTMNTNARGTFLAYKAVAAQMIKQGRGGRIIGECSIMGKKAIPGSAIYSGSMFFVRALTQTAAQEWGPYGITVNAYASGFIGEILEIVEEERQRSGETAEAWRNKIAQMLPVGKLGTPEDVAGLVSYFASKESEYITGQAFNINGGILFD